MAVAFRDRNSKISGLCHYLLDKPLHGEGQGPRYGAVAIPELLKMMVKAGANRLGIEAKLYGGGNVLDGVTIGKNIGASNVLLARSLLNEYKIPILDENVGGTRGRKIIFSTEDFGVMHSFIKDATHVSAKEVEIPLAAVNPLGDGARIIIVDGSSSICSYFSKTLRKKGLNVVGTGTDSAEGYDLVFRQNPELLVLGIIEPGTDGIKMLQELKKYGNLPPVIVYSFGGDGSGAMQCLELGAVDFVHTQQRFDPLALIQVSNVIAEKVTAFLQTGRVAA